MASGEQKTQENNHLYRCRIPQRLPPGRQKKLMEKNKLVNHAEVVYNRPKSASRATEDSTPTVHHPLRSAQPNRERLLPAQKKPAPPLRKPLNEINLVPGNKPTKQIITVPLVSKQKSPMGMVRTIYPSRHFSPLPDQVGTVIQETIKQREDLEGRNNEQTNPIQMYSEGDLHDKESITSRSEKVMRLKLNWQEQIGKFESFKDDLDERQKTLLELYANLLVTHQKLNKLGHKEKLPVTDDLNVMNVAKMTPDQLLQLCSQSKRQLKDNQQLEKIPLDLDIKKLNNMPTKLIALCEETLQKRKEIIDWFDTFRRQEKCTVGSITKKINEFSAENEMLYCSLNNIKSEFLKHLNEIFDYLRNCVSKTVTLQLRTEELTCTLSDLQSKNQDLRKQMYNADQCRSRNNKNRIEELEKMLKDEKVVRDRLSRAQGQIKIGEERARQLETALNLERVHNRDLERTVLQLKERNRTLQSEFDEELSKLNQSIKENTSHLEEIADAREKLQTEKEGLEKRLEELSSHYNESLDNLKQEQSRNVEKIIEIEKKYNEEIEERKKRDTQIEMLCTQLVETELRYKDTVKLLEDQNSLQKETRKLENELKSVKSELINSNAEIEEYKQSLEKKTNIIKDLEKKINQSLTLEEELKCELRHKEKIITELKTSQNDMEQQLHNRDIKMKHYEEQLSSLKAHLAELQERWSEIENLHELHEMVNEQNAKLIEFSRQNNELNEALEKKNFKIQQLCETLKEREDSFTQKEELIKTLLSKDDEHTKIIKLLRNKIEMRAHTDSEANRQLDEKNAEIKTLLSNLSGLKEQINQLEKIILTLEDQIQKYYSQKRIDEERICTLEEELAKHDTRSEYIKEIENPADNLDNLIKILEEELNSPFEINVQKQHQFHKSKGRHDNKRVQRNPMFYRESLRPDHDAFPTKIEMGNFVKKTYLPNNDTPQFNDFECNTESYSHNTRKCIPFRKLETVHTPPELLINNNNIFAHFGGLNPLSFSGDRNVTRDLQYIAPINLKDEKNRKMFKLVGHRL